MSDQKNEPKITRGAVPTHWTYNDKMDEYGMIKVKGKARVPNMGQKVVAMMESRGEEVAVSQPNNYWEQMIDTAGNISNSPLACNRTPGGHFTREDQMDILFNRQELFNAGWLHYETGAPRYGNVGVAPTPEWLAMREQIIADRKAKHNAQAAQWKENWEKQRDEKHEDIRDFMAQLSTTLGGIVSERANKPGRRINPGLAPTEE